MYSSTNGCLYVVATPIGNLADISERALTVLNTVDCIAAEDTRHSARLLQNYGIDKPLISLHEFNETQRSQRLLLQLQQGKNIALISDAGTPTISDPGYRFVDAAHKAHIRVVPIPGASALIAALSASGFSADAFIFAGFLPTKQIQRQKIFATYREEKKTTLFYEAPHRLMECLSDMHTIFGDTREIVLARELTKIYEQVYRGTAPQIISQLQLKPEQQRGECVLILSGNQAIDLNEEEQSASNLLKILLAELSLAQAVKIAMQLNKLPHRTLYQLALKMKP